MIVSQAQAVMQALLGSTPYDHFMDTHMGRTPLLARGRGVEEARGDLLGTDVRATILGAFASHAPRLTCHAHAPVGAPPMPAPVADAAAFRTLIDRYHAGRYTVRIPDVARFSPLLVQLTRAMEQLLLATVDAAIFWSAAEAQAPVHYDEYDIFVVQMVGTKRWFLSQEPPALANPWKQAAEVPPQLHDPRIVDLAPGDLLYLPRGTPHCVQSTSESIHLSIGLSPVTVRDAIQAALDRLADIDRPLREGATGRADALARGEGLDEATAAVQRGLVQLMQASASPAFMADAFSHRIARLIGAMPKLGQAQPPALTLQSYVRHSPLAIAHLVTTDDLVDFIQPGEHILVHRGAEAGLRFIAATPLFRVADIPGPIGDDIRVALATRLVASGFLEVGAG